MVPNQFPPTRAERNVRLWPAELAQLAAEVVLAPADYDGPGLDDPNVVRAYALAGPAATAEGLADVFRDALLVPATEALPATDPRTALPENRDLAVALLDLATHRVDGTERKLDEWRCGTLVPLPALKVDGLWTVLYDQVMDRVGPLLTLFPTPVNNPATDLYGPTAATPQKDRAAPPEPPSVLAATVAGLLGGATPEEVAADLVPALLANPYATCLTVVEVLLQLEAGAGGAAAFAGSLADRLSGPQLDVVAWTTGGNAALRRLWARLAPGQPQYLELAGALGLVLRTPAGQGSPAQYHPPQQRRPTVVPVEPPLTPDQVTIAGRAVGGIALGRRVTHDWTDYKTWQGPTLVGVLPLAPFDEQFGAGLECPAGLTDEQNAERRRVVVAISPAEGNLDAVRLADSALLSLGYQQWSFHTNEEATVLLEHFRRRAPDHFDVFFGLHDLGLTLCTAAGKVDEALPLQVDRKDTATGDAVLAANPRTHTATVPNEPAQYYPTFVTMLHVQPDGDPVVLPLPGRSGARYDYFGWTKAKGRNYGKPAWGARCMVAVHCSQVLQECQLTLGTFRYTRIADEALAWATDWTTGLGGQRVTNLDRRGQRVAATGLRLAQLCPADHTVAELFSAEWSAGLLLDQHINAPKAAKAAIMRAWQRSVDAFLADAEAELAASGGAPSPAEVAEFAHVLMHTGADADTDELDPLFLLRFATSYAALRAYREDGVVLDVFLDRTRRMLLAHDSQLPATRRSFAGWG